MRGALNAYRYNGRQYRRTDMPGSVTIDAAPTLTIMRALALVGSAIIDSVMSLSITRARTLIGSAVLQLVATAQGQVIRIPGRVEFMRRPAGNRSFRRPPQTRVMRGEKST